MKVVNVDGRLSKVFVLSETKDTLVYIPVKACFKVDYIQLMELEKQGGDLLKTLSKTKLKNGRNALVQYDNLIQVLRYTDQSKEKGIRVRKPDEIAVTMELDGSKQEEPKAQEPQKAQTQEQPKQRKKPGPKPGSKRKTKTVEQPKTETVTEDQTSQVSYDPDQAQRELESSIS